MKRLHTLWVGLLSTFLIVWPAYAQGGDTTYTVQTGDTLTHIALKYNLSVARLAAVNAINNPNLIVPGQKITIPFEETQSPVVEASANVDTIEDTYTIQSGDSLYAIAISFGLTLDELAAANGISDVNVIQVGQRLIIPGTSVVVEDAPLPAPFESITLSEPTIVQGRTLVVSVTLSEAADLTARFEDRPISLSGDGQNYWGIVGVHALRDIGLYSIAFEATMPDGRTAAVAQNVRVIAGPYGTETIQVVPGREDLLSPEVIKAEAERVWAVWSQVTPRPLWQGPFIYPIEEVRFTSYFGTRRSYGGGPANSFHAGADFGGGIGVPIYAPAAGVVVLAEPLNVRGNAVLVDHGLGLFSGYWHQSEIAVQVGQTLAPGDLIGFVGDTGLVTGAHLHWEMRLGGIAVEPLQWVQESIP